MPVLSSLRRLPRHLQLLGLAATALLAALLLVLHLQQGAAQEADAPLQLMDLPPGTRMVGTLVFGADLARPSVRFTAKAGPAYGHECESRPVDGCTTIAFQSTFAAQAQHLDVPDTRLEVFSFGQHQKAVVFARGTEPYLILKS